MFISMETSTKSLMTKDNLPIISRAHSNMHYVVANDSKPKFCEILQFPNEKTFSKNYGISSH